MELLFIFISFIVAAILGIFIKRRIVIETFSFAASAVSFVESAVIAFKVADVGIYAPFPFFSIDALGAIVMLIIACVGFFAAAYSVAYFRQETRKGIIGLTRVRQYFMLLDIFMTAMFLAVTANNPIVTWIAIEATTLSTAFLISFYNRPSAMEGAWKYLIINSVGLLLGFLGILLYLTSLYISSEIFVTWSGLLANAARLDPSIAKIAFAFVFIGFGVKVGFAPMHTWKPDAYSKAPAPIGALFSGALLPVAFMVILKYKAITDTVIGPDFSNNILMYFGIFSIAVASLIVLVSRNYKRLLAYSSIEHAGIMALGFGFGGAGVLAATLHMLYHSLIKSALFLLSGNFILAYSSAKIKNVRGALLSIPKASILFFLGIFAIAGIPPFGIFLTKLSVLTAGIQLHTAISITALFLFAIVFVGLFRHVSTMIFGDKTKDMETQKESVWLILPPFVLLAVAFYLSFHIPHFVRALIDNAVMPY